jgi:hypothetical protein
MPVWAVLVTMPTMPVGTATTPPTPDAIEPAALANSPFLNASPALKISRVKPPMGLIAIRTCIVTVE